MSESAQRIAATRRINASAARIFAIVSSAQGHVDVDGSGMLIAADGQDPLTGVGDRFIIHMDRRPLGDIPDMAEYDVENTVTAFEPSRRFEWSVASVGRSPIGHVYGYELTEVSDDATEVTSYCDWSGLPQKWRERVSFPVVPLSALEASLDNLAVLVTAPA